MCRPRPHGRRVAMVQHVGISGGHCTVDGTVHRAIAQWTTRLTMSAASGSTTVLHPVGGRMPNANKRGNAMPKAMKTAPPTR